MARNIANVLLSGLWAERAMLLRLQTALGKATAKSQRALIAEVLKANPASYPPPAAELVRTIFSAPSFEKAAASALRSKAPLHMALRPPKFAPTADLSDCDVPALPTSGDVARWLGLPLEHLDWFTDERRQHGRTAIPDLQHYVYAFRAKPHGPPRLIEAPKPRLKTMQKRILHGILDSVPVHEAAHGFVKGRSCKSGAEQHAEAAIVICFDIADFFLTSPLGRVHALFRGLGYPHAAARVLTRLCSTSTPETVFDRISSPRKHTRAALRAYCEPHLPQGAPTSPALANLVARRLDIRLTGLALSLGGRYSRYADDLTFSGDAAFAKKTNSLMAAVAGIVEDEGYALNERKTRVMTSSRRQQITGIVVNARTNAPRDAYDQLKAILHNCRKTGLAAENRDGHADFRAHLAGRIGWVASLNPARGDRLRAMLTELA
ncbi:MAG: reverse transcriptase family protein [Hyphomicrobium sp.]